MNRRPPILRASVTLLMLLMVTACGAVGLDLGDDTTGGEWTHEVPLSEGLERVDATITFNEGRLQIAGRSDDLLTGRFLLDEPGVTPDVLFEGAGPNGRLRIEQRKDPDLSDDEWTLNLSDAVEFDLTVQVGAGAVDLDLRELDVQSFRADIGTGDTGISLSGDLADAAVALGAGNLTIDVSDVESAAFVDISVGVGDVEVFVPSAITVEIRADQGLGEVDAAGFEGRDGSLVREGDGESETVLTVEVDGGVGRLTVASGP